MHDVKWSSDCEECRVRDEDKVDSTRCEWRAAQSSSTRPQCGKKKVVVAWSRNSNNPPTGGGGVLEGTRFAFEYKVPSSNKKKRSQSGEIIDSSSLFSLLSSLFFV